MQITWNIQKKRGNFRPCLNYSLILESFEKKLAINAIQIETLIPQIPNPHQNYCMPGENERSPPSVHPMNTLKWKNPLPCSEMPMKH